MSRRRANTPAASPGQPPPVLTELQTLDSDLAEAIRASLPTGSSALPEFLELSYSYGDLIVNNSQFQFPPDRPPPDSFCDRFAPHGIPLAVVVDKAVEIFTEGPGPFTAPLRVLYPGEIFGAFEAADHLFGISAPSVSTYSISSGVRSIWIVAPLGDRRLRNICWSFKSDRSHFDVASAIAAERGISWKSRIVCLPYALLRRDGGELSPLGVYILKTAWVQSTVHRKQFSLDRRIAELCTDPDYLAYAEVVKHIVSVVRGLAPAHRAWDKPGDVGGPFAAVREEIETRLRKNNARNSKPHILMPVQLKNAHDFGFFSFHKAVPGMPLGVKLPKYGPELARATCAILSGRTRQPVNLPQTVALNESSRPAAKLTFYCRGWLTENAQRGGQPFLEHTELSKADFGGQQDIYRKDSFLLSCVRIERNA